MKSDALEIAKAVIALAEERGGKALVREVAQALLREAGGDGAIAVTIITPSGDAGALTGEVATMIEKKFGKPASLTQKKDESLIGGVILQFGDERIDMSVKGSLEQCESMLRSRPLS